MSLPNCSYCFLLLSQNLCSSERSYPLLNILSCCHKKTLWEKQLNYCSTFTSISEQFNGYFTYKYETAEGKVLPSPQGKNESQYTNIQYFSYPSTHCYQCCPCTLVPHNNTITKTHKHSFSQILSALSAHSIGSIQEKILWWSTLSIQIIAKTCIYKSR